MQYVSKDKATNAVDLRKSPGIQMTEPQPLHKKNCQNATYLFETFQNKTSIL